MANDLNRSIKIYIDGSDAQKGISKVEAAITKLEAKLASLNKGEADYEAKSKELQKELNAKNRTLETYKQKVAETERVLNNLSGSTYQELLSVQKQVRKELQNSVPGSEKYNAALEQNRRITRQVTAAQKAMRVEVGAQGNIWLRASNFLNQYLGIIGTIVAAVTGLTLKLNQLREARNKREEAKADVQALTGLDEESINWLEDQAKRLSTSMDENGIRIRQTATEILDAYKLVGSAKPELLEDKEALNAVTKQALILAQASGMTLKDAVDAVTLSLNQFGDGADQAARYANVMAAGSKYGSAAVESVTKALRNSGVAAASANVSIEQTVGMIETLAEKGIKDEVAGTGLKKFFLTLQTGADDTNPKIVGLSTALDNLAAKQLNATKIKEMFGEEGYNVASVLINETEKVKYYTEAVTGTGVAIEQAGIKSNTAAAKLAQAKNRMQEMGIELMENLNPGLVSAANGMVNWAQKGVKLVAFLVEYKGSILGAATALATLTAGQKLYVAMSKLSDYWTNQCDRSVKKLTKTMARNIWGLVAMGAGALVGHLIEVRAKNDELNQSMTSTERITRKTVEGFAEQEGKIRALSSVVNDSAVSLDKRREALDNLKEIVPGYNALLSDEGTLTNNNTEAIKAYLVQLEKQIKMKAAMEELEELYKRERKLTAQESEQSETYWDIRQQNTLQGYDRNSLTARLSRLFGTEKEGKALKALQNTRKELEEVRNAISDINKEIGETSQTIDEVNNDSTGDGNPSNSSGGASVDEKEREKLRKEALEREKILYELAQADITRIYTSGKDDELQTEQQYNDRLLDAKKKYLQRVIEISGSGTKEAVDAEKQLADLQLQEKQEAIKHAIEAENQLYADQQRQLKEAYANGTDDNLKTHEDYQDALEQLEMIHLNRMLEIAGLDEKARKEIEDRLLEYRIKCQKEFENYLKKGDKDRDKVDEETLKKIREAERKYEQMFTRVKGYAEQFGNALGDVISGQKSAMEALGDATIDIIYDVLNEKINARLTELATDAAYATAAGGMKEIGSKGIAGIATSAVIAAAVGGLLATARSALKGLLNKRGGDSDTGGSSSISFQRVPTVNQYATGRYDVIGLEDGRSYRGVPYIGPAPTGIVEGPALVSERGSELIVNADDLRRLQKHINYPLVMQAINESRGHVTQHASGNYSGVNISPVVNEPAAAIPSELLSRFLSVIERIERNGIPADVVLTDLERKQKQRDRSRKIGSK